MLQGSGTGIDSAVLDLEGDLLVVTTDPVTAAAANMGRLCVHICCNDIAAEGAEPVAIFVTMLVPLMRMLKIFKPLLKIFMPPVQRQIFNLRGTYRKDGGSEAHNSFGDGDWAKNGKKSAGSEAGRRIDYDQRGGIRRKQHYCFGFS